MSPAADEMRRYFPDQLLEPDAELSEEAALRRAAYVAAVARADRVERLEIIMSGRVQQVVYLDTSPPDAEVTHRARYPDSGMIVRRQTEADSWTIDEDREFSPAGDLVGTTRSYSRDGRPSHIEYLDGEGRPIRRDVFVHEGDRLVGIRVLDSAGEELYRDY